MSSLLKEDLNKKLFRTLGQKLYGFIEIECSGQDRFYLCASVAQAFQNYAGTYTHTNTHTYTPRDVGDVLPPQNLFSKMSKREEVQISVVKHYRIGLDENYEISQKWLLDDLEMIDGREADSDNPWFDMHFKQVYTWEAYSCASKYAFARILNKLNEMYLQKDLKIVNFDFTYINDTALWSSNNGDCLVLMSICFYAFNLVCLSLCPMPG